MYMICELQDKIFNVSATGFDALSLAVFRFQFDHNPLYRAFTQALHIRPESVTSPTSIPFLPIHFFKTHAVAAGTFDAELVFESSGTTRTGNSRHLVRDAGLYRQSFASAFELFYGSITDWCIIGLLPSYLERGQSSLVVMVDELIKKSQHPASGFYLYEHERLMAHIAANEHSGQKTLLIGVTFALLDLAAAWPRPLRHTIVMETGGMKGRRKEITREEVHGILKKAWQLPAIHSEYGMTELLSQAYSHGDGIFQCPPWLRVMVRDEDDPLTMANASRGLINVIDLANLHSCSFIATDDIGLLHAGGAFEVMGRMDNSDVRGCSLMYAF